MKNITYLWEDCSIGFECPSCGVALVADSQNGRMECVCGTTYSLSATLNITTPLEKQMTLESIARKVIRQIMKDIRERQGIGDELKQCEADVVEEITDTWEKIVIQALRDAVNEHQIATGGPG